MDKQDFLLEIGCEELPSSSLEKLANALNKNLQALLQQHELTHGTPQVFATPRRLAVMIPELDAEQPSRVTERQGPSAEKAFDRDGTPTLACLGFVRSCGVSVDELKMVETPKGKRVTCTIKHDGAPTMDLLPDIVKQAIKKLPIPKPMRWGDHDISFIRPVHWVVMLFGHELVPANILGKPTTRETFGHRFMHPKALTISKPQDYSMLLFSHGFVVANFTERKALIEKRILETANNNNAKAVIDPDLLNEVTSLVEWPVIQKGQFNPELLSVPKEALMTSMKTHQKCFPLQNKTGELLPFFILVSNIESKEPQTVVTGNERVINARLCDAQFFYQNDLKRSLDARLEKLDQVIFQNQLGTLKQKAERISELAGFIAKEANVEVHTAKRAGLLCKSDLVSEMVYEFPSLQGVMGYYYALNDQESESCAKAILEHYKPSFSKDTLPDSLPGACVALADKLDTLVGILGINQIPTGDKDPFALRRAAQGIVRILIEKELPLDLLQLLEKAHTQYDISLPNKHVVQHAFDFMMDRLKYWYLDQGVIPEIFEAVMVKKPTMPLDFHRRILAVQQFQALPEAKALAAANKRVSNILRKQLNEEIPESMDENLFDTDAERNLSTALTTSIQAVEALYADTEYTKALSYLSHLKEPVDTFFDEVMVLVEDDKQRKNRLALLMTLRKLFTRVADISLLPQ